MTDPITIGRCADCRWWKDLNSITGLGTCSKISHTMPSLMSGVKATIVYHPNFGCVAFERRGADKLAGLVVKITPAEEGGYVAECVTYPGCFSQGESVDEAANNLAAAVIDWEAVGDA